MNNPMLDIRNLGKGFTMHLRGGVHLPVVTDVHFQVMGGECVVLGGASGAGKSSLLKMIYGNYTADAGEIFVSHDGKLVDLASATPRAVLDIRRRTIGYVSQFLSVIPRVSAQELVAEAAQLWGVDSSKAQIKAGDMLARLNIPERLWDLPPATFSGGEQQRVNIARGFMGQHPILLLDEPTASLDAANRQVVLELIAEKKLAGTALLGIFHDPDTRDAVADRIIDVSSFAKAA